MILKTINLSQKYKKHFAVKSLNLTVEKGSLTALLGTNGAGKSTTIRMLTGIDRPSSGEILYTPHTNIGVVFQNSVLDDILTVRENLEIRSKQYKNSNLKQVKLLIHDLGLNSFSEQTYGTLSGGQKRRVDIARALLNNPDILFLDEPTTGLDIQTRLAIWGLLHKLQKDKRLTIVLTTHYLDEADHANQVYIVDHGKIITSGSSSEIKNKYAKSKLILVSHKIQKLLLVISNQTPVKQISKNELLLTPKNDSEAIDFLSQNKKLLDGFEYHVGTMDDAFVNLTGKEMR